MELSAEQREVVIMKEFEGLKFREIAEVLNISENTVKSRMYYGLDGFIFREGMAKAKAPALKKHRFKNKKQKKIVEALNDRFEDEDEDELPRRRRSKSYSR